MAGIVAHGALRPQSVDQSRGRVIPFGKYLLLERLAVGGMAEVYLAKSFGVEGFEKLLAIKRILPTMAEDEDFITMFVDEAKIAGQLAHPNIAPIYELGKLGESHYIAMEFIWGKDLLQIMNRYRRLRKRMPAPMAAWIVSKICQGLDYAHKKVDQNGEPLHVIHRDVSPQNILVSYEGQIKIIDFGIAKATSRTTTTQAGVLKGKFGYMSPEQVRGQPIDHRSDVFAVGTCLYEMLTGERLFIGESDFSTLEKVRNADVAPPSVMVPGIPAEMDAVVLKALSRDSDTRYASAGELYAALQPIVNAQGSPFSAAHLSAWMKTAFATELAQEKARLESYGQLGRSSSLRGPSKDVAPADDASSSAERPAVRISDFAPAGSSEDVASENTVVSGMPEFSGEDEEGPTNVYFHSEDFIEKLLQSQAVEASERAATEGTLDSEPSIDIDMSEDEASSISGEVLRPNAFGSDVSTLPPLASKALSRIQFFQTLPTAQWQRYVTESKGWLGENRSFLKVIFVILVAAAMLSVGYFSAWIALDGQRTSTLEIQTQPATAATVFVDGVNRGSTPARMRVKVGQHWIQVRARGFTPATRRIRVRGGSPSRIQVQLAPQRPTME